jgi:hypothetical protein
MFDARSARWVTVFLLVVVASSIAFAQDSKSTTLVGELVKLLDAKKLDSIAAKFDGTEKDKFVVALYFAGSQLLVVSARYSVPQRMEEQLKEKNYRDVYIDLNSASVPQSKIFISDLGANGLHARREDNQPFDTADIGGKSYSFDGDWGRAKLSEEEYTKTFQMTEQEYVRMLEALVAELKKTS